MTTTALQSYRYRSSSALADGRLLLSTSGSHPRFFTGFLTAPAATAAGLLALADVARANYLRPVRVTYRDPIVTGHADGLRFESFSGCCGVYARLDVPAAALDGELPEHGTTNVDINQPLYTALSRVGAGDPLRLSVGPDDLTVSTLDGAVVEKKVPLPVRWLRGLAEVPSVAAGFDPRATLSIAEAAALLARLPSRPGHEVRWLVPAGRTLRSTTTPTPGAICLAGPHRLAALRPLLRHATALRVYGPPVTRAGTTAAGPGTAVTGRGVAAAGGGAVVAGHAAAVVSRGAVVAGPGAVAASGWELEMGAVRLTLVLSPAVARGFSGEGGVLEALASEEAGDDAEVVRPLLGWAPLVDVDELAGAAALPADRVRAALSVLATAGVVGFDAARAGWFHRELPYDPDLLADLNPRLAAARALVTAGAVTTTATGVQVRSGAHTYLLHRTPTGAYGCTCPWWTTHRGDRGPCKHALAATLTEAPDTTASRAAPAEVGGGAGAGHPAVSGNGAPAVDPAGAGANGAAGERA
jgi:hypothetical protein